MKTRIKRQEMHKQKNKRNIRILYVSGITILISIIMIYLFFVYYYSNHFFTNTVINGIKTSNMKVDEAKEAINAQVRAYQLTITGRNNISDTIDGEMINLQTLFDNTMVEFIDKQNPFLWPVAIFQAHEKQATTMIEYDEALLEKYYKGLKFFQKENIIKPKNAKISKYGEKGYEIIPEDPGAQINSSKLYEAVVRAIDTLEPSLIIEETGAYKKAKITSDNPDLIKALDKMNLIAGSEITYEFGEDVEILDGKLISEWLSVDKNFDVKFDTDKVKEYVDYIGKTYNSFGKTREFSTSYGKVIKVVGGDYGWWLNRPEEVKELTQLIEKGEKLKKEPVYFQTAQQYGLDDVGNTYVEVNLTAQHLFFYKEGKLILESDFVSGNLAKKYDSPTGTFPVQYKERDATLVGEDYETPVKYWMPFYRNIGFHDAYWRKDFGKDIYLTKGSHGCINMPPEKAKIMFDNIQRGIAVIAYELPGTENYDVEALKAKQEQERLEQKKKEQEKKEQEKKEQERIEQEKKEQEKKEQEKKEQEKKEQTKIEQEKNE